MHLQTEWCEAGGLAARRAGENQRLAIESGVRTAALEPLDCKIILTLRPTLGAYCYLVILIVFLPPKLRKTQFCTVGNNSLGRQPALLLRA